MGRYSQVKSAREGIGHRVTEDTEKIEAELKSRPPEKGGISHRGRERFFPPQPGAQKAGAGKSRVATVRMTTRIENRIRMTARTENRR